jgi:hypothetical protein
MGWCEAVRWLSQQGNTPGFVPNFLNNLNAQQRRFCRMWSGCSLDFHLKVFLLASFLKIHTVISSFLFILIKNTADMVPWKTHVRLHLNYLKRRRSTVPRGREKGSFFKFLQFEWNKVHQGENGICVIYLGFSAETIVRISPEMLRTSFMKLTITLYK